MFTNHDLVIYKIASNIMPACFVKTTFSLSIFMFQDCRTIKQGSLNDSDVVEDYRKQKSQYGSPQVCTIKKVICIS